MVLGILIIADSGTESVKLMFFCIESFTVRYATIDSFLELLVYLPRGSEHCFASSLNSVFIM